MCVCAARGTKTALRSSSCCFGPEGDGNDDDNDDDDDDANSLPDSIARAVVGQKGVGEARRLHF